MTIADTNSVTEDTTPNYVTGNILTNDSDTDGDTLSVTNAGTFMLSYGALAINANGSYTYTLDNSNPLVNALNTGQWLSDVFTYNVSDGHGGRASSTLTITINGTSEIAPPSHTIDLSTLSTGQGFVIQGGDYDETGSSVSSAGDVNGDGFEDVIVGAPGADAAYIIFGTDQGVGSPDSSGRQVIDITTLDASQGFIILGDTDRTGWDVSSAGDVNGDGFDDLIVGSAPSDDWGSKVFGEAYVIFGTDEGFGTPDSSGRPVIDVTTLDASRGFIIQGKGAKYDDSWSVSSAGDVNGDGFDDLILGGDAYDQNAYVVFGTDRGFGENVDSRQVVNLATLDPNQGYVISYGYAGWDVSSAGDVNGDGFDDLILGAPGLRGEAYVIFGTDSGGGQTIDLWELDPDQGFVIPGEAAYDRAGWSVSSAGDVNGDGFDDVIVGAPFDTYIGWGSTYQAGSASGEAYVVFGTDQGVGETDSRGRWVIDLATLDASRGFVIQGDAAGDDAGYSVSSAGDVNGDGFDDLIIGVPSSAGAAYVVFGTDEGFGAEVGGRRVIDLTTLNSNQGFLIQGYDHRLGVSVSSAGDVNGDGFDDMIAGAPNGGGEAYVILGGAFGNANAPVTTTGTSAAEMLIGGSGDDILTGNGGADVFRGGAGDDAIGVTGTGFADIDGGNGTDTLRIDGPGDVFDFALISSTRISSIEAIDLGAAGSQNVSLDRLDILDMSDDRSGGITTLTIRGDAGDTVTVTDTGWTAAGVQTTIGTDTFDIYLNGQARLLVEHDIDIVL